ncbi:MAG: hypothetical protein U0Z75_01315 [Deinococcaceae bacterium]
MSKSPPVSLQGKRLEDVIVSPALWARYVELASRSSDITGSLQQLLSKVQAIHGSVARARQAQVMLILNRPLKEIEELLTPYLHHPLCKAMHLTVILSRNTLEAYQYIAVQSEFVVTTRLEIPDREAQLRWDFARAQGLQGAGRLMEALNFYSIAHRAAIDLGINSIATFSLSRINLLTSDSQEERIESLLLSLEQAEQTGDSRITNPILYSLCVQYAYLDDYESVLYYAQQISKHPVQQHLVQGSKLLLGLPRTEELPSLEGLEGHAFSVMTHVLADFQQLKQTIDVCGNREDAEVLAKRVIGYTIAIDLDIPMAAIIGLCLQAMTYSLAGDFKTTRVLLEQARKLVIETENLPRYAQSYVEVIKADLMYKESEDAVIFMEASIKHHLEKSKVFQRFLVLTCPHLVYAMHEDRPSKPTEEMMKNIIVVSESNILIGEKTLGCLPEVEWLKEAMERWYEGDPMEKEDEQILREYGKKIERVEHGGVVVKWRLDGSVALDLKWKKI